MTTAETFIDQRNNPDMFRYAPNNESTLLGAGINYQINPNIPIFHEGEYDVTAIIDCGKNELDDKRPDLDPRDEFLLIDLRDAPITARGKLFQGGVFTRDAEYLLIDRSFSARTGSDDVGYKAIRLGETFTVGQNNSKARARFNLGNRTSREHFSISLDREGNLSIVDHGSTNGTRVTTASKLEREDAGYNQAHGKTQGNEGRQHNSDNGNEGGREAGRDRQNANYNARQQPQEQAAKKEKSPEELAEEKWKKEKELALAPLNDSVRRVFDQVESEYRKLLPASAIAEVIQSIATMKLAGMTDRQKIKIALFKQYHPDRAGEDKEAQELNTRKYQLADRLCFEPKRPK